MTIPPPGSLVNLKVTGNAWNSPQFITLSGTGS
jgi:hypothetical protein